MYLQTTLDESESESGDTQFISPLLGGEDLRVCHLDAGAGAARFGNRHHIVSEMAESSTAGNGKFSLE